MDKLFGVEGKSLKYEYQKRTTAFIPPVMLTDEYAVPMKRKWEDFFFFWLLIKMRKVENRGIPRLRWKTEVVRLCDGSFYMST